MRGPTGVGKSFLAYDIARQVDLPVIDVRGACMDESKASGLPDFISSKELGVATYVLPSWFVRSCREPTVLLLDEINRSMPQVMQAFFQVVLDRQLGNDSNGNSMALHPDTRVIAAGNFGNEYDVNEMDAALLRRFWVVDIETNTNDWIDWALQDDNIDRVTIDFIRQNPHHLRVDPSSVETGTVVPTPASWHRLDQSLRHMGMSASDVAGHMVDSFYSLATGFVGVEAAIAYREFVAKYAVQISAEMVLDGKVGKKEAKKMKASESFAVIDKLIVHVTDRDWTDDEVVNVINFITGVSEEQLVHFWNKVMESKRMVTIQKLHAHRIGDRVIDMVRKAKALSTAK